MIVSVVVLVFVIVSVIGALTVVCGWLSNVNVRAFNYMVAVVIVTEGTP